MPLRQFLLQNSPRLGDDSLTGFFRSLAWQVQYGRTDTAFAPKKLLAMLTRHLPRKQQRKPRDPHEVLHHIFDGLKSEESLQDLMRDALDMFDDISPSESPKPSIGGTALVDQLFGGQMRTSVVCLNCGSVTCSTETVFDLSLAVPKKGDPLALQRSGDAVPVEMSQRLETFRGRLPEERSHSADVSASLRALTAPALLQGTDGYVCEQCCAVNSDLSGVSPRTDSQFVTRPALTRMTLVQPPPFLVLHFKNRASKGKASSPKSREASQKIKIEETISFTCSPHVPPMDEDELLSQLEAEQEAPAVHYRLYSVVEYVGDGRRGHYKASTRLGKRWLLADDETVRRTSLKDALKVQPLMLFYELLRRIALARGRKPASPIFFALPSRHTRHTATRLSAVADSIHVSCVEIGRTHCELRGGAQAELQCAHSREVELTMGPDLALGAGGWLMPHVQCAKRGEDQGCVRRKAVYIRCAPAPRTEDLDARSPLASWYRVSRLVRPCNRRTARLQYDQ
eukprot:2928412-Prymnesium_polylepis.1